MSDPITIYHNPRCSKSRQTLALIEAHDCQAEIVEYLKTPPDTATLEDILQKLSLEPRALMRKKEAPYSDLNLEDPNTSRDALIQAMVDYPILIERPIVVRGDKAVLGRPPENVTALLS